MADFYDFHTVHLVMYESWTASFHRLASVNASTHTAQLASHYNAQWANQAAGSRYYVENAREHLDAADLLRILLVPPKPKSGGGAAKRKRE